MSVYMVIKMSV